MKTINELTKRQLAAFGPLVVLIFLIYITWSFGYSKIGDIGVRIKKAEAEKSILNRKLSTLKGVSSNLKTKTEAAAIVLPEKNPAVVVLSQVRTLGTLNNVLVGNIKSGGEVADPSGFQRVDISFDATGGRASVLQMISGINTLAPITLLSKVKLNETGNVVRATIELKSFWAPLPTQLPALSESISELSNSEVTLLESFESLMMPTLTDVVALEASGRVDPFAP